jgi:glycosyltransferase involved in cell wall biosynthesis
MPRVNRPPQLPIAVFLTSFHPGGTERQMTELVRRLDRRTFDVHVACFHPEGAWLTRVRECAPVTAFPIRGFGRPATAARIAAFARWCRRRGVQVVQTCDLYSNVFGLIGAWLAGVPVRIGSRRELNPDKRPAQLRLQRLAYRAAHRVVANSPAAAQQLLAERVPAGRISMISNGVDAGVFDEGAAARPSAIPAPGAMRRIISVGNLRPEKGHDTLLDAAQRVLASGADVRIQIVGDGPCRSGLEALARERGIAGRVDFLGHREDVPSLLAAADIFVLASRSEAFPNAAVEAMAAGVPVIASAVGGLIDLIEPERTGLLVPPGDAAGLASALEKMLDRPADAARLGRAGQRAVRTRYSFGRMIDAFESLYLTEIAARRPLGALRTLFGVSLQPR